MGYKRNTASSSRIKHLEKLLEPGESLNFDVYKAVEKICGRELTEVDDNLLKELDDAINRYLNFAIEYDRLTRRRLKLGCKLKTNKGAMESAVRAFKNHEARYVRDESFDVLD